MRIKRFIAAIVVLGLAAGLGSCGQFSGYVADSWPHWAGGLPADAPPRPGTPGYEEFIAHGETGQDATKSIAGSQKPNAGATKASVPAATNPQATPALQPAPTAQAAPVDTTSPEDSSVVKGGLY